MKEVNYYDKPLKLKGTVKKDSIELDRIPMRQDFVLGKADVRLQKSFRTFIFNENKKREKQELEPYSIRTWSEDGYLYCNRRK